MLRLVANVIGAIALIMYPVVLWLGMRSEQLLLATLVAAALVMPALALRVWGMRRVQEGSRPGAASRSLRVIALIPLITVVCLLLSAALRHQGLALLTPVAINAVLFAAFASTLRWGPPMIERFARLQDPELNIAQVRWCRLWTLVWCAYFLWNITALIALITYAPASWWAIYTSLIAYVLMGVLFAAERFGRWYRFERRPKPSSPTSSLIVVPLP